MHLGSLLTISKQSMNKKSRNTHLTGWGIIGPASIAWGITDFGSENKWKECLPWFIKRDTNKRRGERERESMFRGSSTPN